MKTVIAVLLALASSLPSVTARDIRYLPAGEPNPVALLAPPPLPDSPEQAADLAEVRSVVHATSPQETAAALSESSFSVFVFAPEIGPVFQPGKLPGTEEFLQRVRKDAETEINTAKNYWKRPRPYTVDPTLAGGKLEKSFSYPSGHSTGSMVLGLVLADLFPEKREAILTKARLIGWHRVEIARHYATDIYAGRVFAQAIVSEMKKNPNFQKDLIAAKAEIQNALQSARN